MTQLKKHQNTIRWISKLYIKTINTYLSILSLPMTIKVKSLISLLFISTLFIFTIIFNNNWHINLNIFLYNLCIYSSIFYILFLKTNFIVRIFNVFLRFLIYLNSNDKNKPQAHIILNYYIYNIICIFLAIFIINRTQLNLYTYNQNLGDYIFIFTSIFGLLLALFYLEQDISNKVTYSKGLINKINTLEKVYINFSLFILFSIILFKCQGTVYCAEPSENEIKQENRLIQRNSTTNNAIQRNVSNQSSTNIVLRNTSVQSNEANQIIFPKKEQGTNMFNRTNNQTPYYKHSDIKILIKYLLNKNTQPKMIEYKIQPSRIAELDFRLRSKNTHLKFDKNAFVPNKISCRSFLKILWTTFQINKKDEHFISPYLQDKLNKEGNLGIEKFKEEPKLKKIDLIGKKLEKLFDELYDRTQIIKCKILDNTYLFDDDNKTITDVPDTIINSHNFEELVIEDIKLQIMNIYQSSLKDRNDAYLLKLRFDNDMETYFNKLDSQDDEFLLSYHLTNSSKCVERSYNILISKIEELQRLEGIESKREELEADDYEYSLLERVPDLLDDQTHPFMIHFYNKYPVTERSPSPSLDEDEYEYEYEYEEDESSSP
uniref:hypothetical protein n=1 Tax=Phellinidium ferrugineofuscum TaxID=167367 RepID=UPI0023AA8BE1|nr:hypothetical protein P1Q01_mgp20 [Phellinidium ferrugineofuscum]WCF76806.1 hypothetical protein [Phellinidium ferrugineofuscum]